MEVRQKTPGNLLKDKSNNKIKNQCRSGKYLYACTYLIPHPNLPKERKGLYLTSLIKIAKNGPDIYMPYQNKHA